MISYMALFGTEVFNLQVMGLEFAPDGTLYGVGDANRASPTFNSLYTVDLKTGNMHLTIPLIAATKPIH